MSRIGLEGGSSEAYIVTGPTSGIGRATAMELAKHGTVVLVGRNRDKLDEVKKAIEQPGGRAVSVVCDLSDLVSVRRAAAEIVGLGLPLAGLVNNAGMMETRPTKNGLGWDMSFATNHVGPFVLTETLSPTLPDGAAILFVVSAVEDPERKPAVRFGFRGGRYLSAEASARGEWKAGGSTQPGFDSYATSKQAVLAAAMAFAREMPRLRIQAIEPGLTLATGLGGRDFNAVLRVAHRIVAPLVAALLMPFFKLMSTPKRAGRVITKVLLDGSGKSGTYYNESGQPMQGSVQVRDREFQERVVAETRALLPGIASGLTPRSPGREADARRE